MKVARKLEQCIAEQIQSILDSDSYAYMFKVGTIVGKRNPTLKKLLKLSETGSGVYPVSKEEIEEVIRQLKDGTAIYSVYSRDHEEDLIKQYKLYIDLLPVWYMFVPKSMVASEQEITII